MIRQNLTDREKRVAFEVLERLGNILVRVRRRGHSTDDDREELRKLVQSLSELGCSKEDVQHVMRKLQRSAGDPNWDPKNHRTSYTESSEWMGETFGAGSGVHDHHKSSTHDARRRKSVRRSKRTTEDRAEFFEVARLCLLVVPIVFVFGGILSVIVYYWGPILATHNGWADWVPTRAYLTVRHLKMLAYIGVMFGLLRAMLPQVSAKIIGYAYAVIGILLHLTAEPIGIEWMLKIMDHAEWEKYTVIATYFWGFTLAVWAWSTWKLGYGLGYLFGDGKA